MAGDIAPRAALVADEADGEAAADVASPSVASPSARPSRRAARDSDARDAEDSVNGLSPATFASELDEEDAASSE